MKGFEVSDKILKEARDKGGIAGAEVKILTEEGLVYNIVDIEAEKATTDRGVSTIWLKVEEEDLDG